MRASIDRWDPFRDLVSIQDELSRLFGRTFVGPQTTPSSAGGKWMPPMDVFETEDRIVAELELPGIEADEVDVSVEDSTLTVSGSREFTDELKDENVHRVERRYGAFTRAITLPRTVDTEVDTEKVEAQFDNGVLRVEVPKVERAKTKRIEIKAAS